MSVPNFSSLARLEVPEKFLWGGGDKKVSVTKWGCLKVCFTKSYIGGITEMSECRTKCSGAINFYHENMKSGI